MLGNFLKIGFIVVCLLKPIKSLLVFMENDRLSCKQAGSQASCRVTRRLAWIQPVCISINAVPGLKGLSDGYMMPVQTDNILKGGYLKQNLRLKTRLHIVYITVSGQSMGFLSVYLTSL